MSEKIFDSNSSISLSDYDENISDVTYLIDYKKDVLSIENVPLVDIAEKYGTPSYVYSSSIIRKNFESFRQAFGDYPAEICYAVKANSNLAVLNLLAKYGAGFDIVSGGELARVIAAKGDPKKVVFSGVGKTEEEIIEAIQADIACFNVESREELEQIEKIAEKLGKIASIGCRVNPDVDAHTHPHITTGLKECKFGISMEEAYGCYRFARKSKFLNVKSIACHIGSQITDVEPFLQALEQLINMQKNLEKEGIKISHLDVGGGLGIRYCNETPPSIYRYCHAIKEKVRPHDLSLTIACGRSLVANSGVLLTKIIRVKESICKNFAIVDAGMNDFIRPALYNGWHRIQEVRRKTKIGGKIYDVVGPVCESADFFGKERSLKIESGDLLVVRDVGAYGYCLSSNYNSRLKAAEILVNGEKIFVIKSREKIEELFRNEIIPF